MHQNQVLQIITFSRLQAVCGMLQRALKLWNRALGGKTNAERVAIILHRAWLPCSWGRLAWTAGHVEIVAASSVASLRTQTYTDVVVT